MKKFRLSLILILAVFASLLVFSTSAHAASTMYDIHSITPRIGDEGKVMAEVTSWSNSALIVASYDNQGAMVDSGYSLINGSTGVKYVEVQLKIPAVYTLKAFLIDPETFEPLCSERNYTNSSQENNYSITALSAEGTGSVVTVTTDEACKLIVEVLNEDTDKVVSSGETTVGSGLSLSDVSVTLSKNVPNRYKVRARLVDDNGSDLCTPFVTLKYTLKYKIFESRTAASYNRNNFVADFGENGYGVLVDGAKAVSTPANVSLDYTEFVISPSFTPRIGDVLLITDENGAKMAIKLSYVGAKSSQGTYTVRADQNAQISDLYKVFSLNATFDAGAAINASGVAPMLEKKGDDDSLELVSISTGFTTGPLTVSVSGTASVVVKAVYAPEFFGEDYIETETYLETSIKADVTLDGKFKSSDIKDAFGNAKWPEFTFYEGPISLVGAGVVGANLKISFPLEFEFGAEGRASISVTNKSGYYNSTTSGLQKISSNEIESKFEVAGVFEVRWGPKVELNVFVLKHLFEGGISGQAGVKAKGEIAKGLDSTTGPKTHGCDVCVDLEFAAFYNIHGELKLEVSEKCRADLLNIDILNGEHDMGRAYYSIKNDPDSLFKGEAHFDKGTCPNYKYRVEIITVDLKSKTVSGIPVEVTGELGLKGEGSSPVVCYLYDGDYTATADFASGTISEVFSVNRQATTVKVKEAETRLSGYVTDAETGAAIPNATVNITWSDGTKQGTTANGEGFYELIITPRESGSITVDAENYSPLTKELEVTAGEENIFNAALAVCCDVTFTVVDTKANPMKGLTILGTGLKTAPVTGENGKVTVELEKGEYTFGVTASGKSACVDYVVDGEEEITITLQANFIEWWYDEPTKTLYVNGLGPMPSYIGGSPWKAHASQMEHVVITGLSSVGSDAFRGYSSIIDVQFPSVLTSLNYHAFDGCKSLKRINLPEELTTVGESVFRGCESLTDVVFPRKLTTIGSYAFHKTGLKTVELYDEIKNINDFAFSQCPSLTTVTIEGSPSGTSLNYQCFENCKSLTTVNLGKGVAHVKYGAFRSNSALTTVNLAEGLLSIENYSFNECRAIGSLTIPDTVTWIGEYAFTNSIGLTSLTLGKNLNSIGFMAFYNSGITSLSIPESVTSIADRAFDKCTSLTTVTVPGNEAGTSLGMYAFRDCTSLASAVIGNKVNSIGHGAFQNCTSLSTVNLGQGITGIGNYAFQNCTSLSSVVIPDSVTWIGEYAFNNCTGLASVSFGKGVKTFGLLSFANSGITVANFPESVTGIGDKAFRDCKSLASVVIPGNKAGTSLGLDTFHSCTALTSVTMGGTVASVSYGAFAGCTALSSVSLTEGIGSIGKYAFQACESLGSINIPTSITSIADYAFERSGLGSIVIAPNVKSMGVYAFANSDNLTSAHIYGNENGTWIGDHCFKDCDALTSVTIGSNVTGVGMHVFQSCDKLVSVSIGPDVKSLGGSSFADCVSLTSISIPSNVESINMNAFAGCKNLSVISLNEGLKTIGQSAFGGLPITTLSIPSSVTYIGASAFRDCKNLTSVYIGGCDESGTGTDVNAFLGCSKLSTVTFGTGVKNIGAATFYQCPALKTVICEGGSAQWESMIISSGNDDLIRAYNS